MPDHDRDVPVPAMSLGRAFVFYLGAVIGMAAVGVLALSAIIRTSHPMIAFWAGFVAYLAIGLFLNRRVLSALIEWHPMHDTIGEIARSKATMLLFWPYKYADLFFQMLVSRHL
jgi:hypothetical protein